ncbi:hypothetical protein ACJX0J_015624, partial [Zea mays]
EIQSLFIGDLDLNLIKMNTQALYYYQVLSNYPKYISLIILSIDALTTASTFLLKKVKVVFSILRFFKEGIFPTAYPFGMLYSGLAQKRASKAEKMLAAVIVQPILSIAGQMIQEERTTLHLKAISYKLDLIVLACFLYSEGIKSE